jgi:hypothetical protein
VSVTIGAVISRYVERLPWLQFTTGNSALMADYGYRYDDDETGAFRSRLSPHELEQTDRRRAVEVAASR